MDFVGKARGDGARIKAYGFAQLNSQKAHMLGCFRNINTELNTVIGSHRVAQNVVTAVISRWV